VIGHGLALLADALLIAAAAAVGWRITRPAYIALPLLLAGAGLAGVSLSSAWLALGPLRMSIRLAAAPVVALGAVLLAILPLASAGANAAAVIGLFVAGVVQFLALQAPYWLLRLWHRLQIVHLKELEGGGPIDRLQYSLWQMLLVMTLVAVALAIGRGVFALAGTARQTGDVGTTLLLFFSLLVAYNLLLAWPLLWGVLSPLGIAWKFPAAGALAALVVVAAYPLTNSVLPGEGQETYWLIFAPQPAFLLAHLFATRVAGYRLVRWT
jgi:hypothetical protein